MAGDRVLSRRLLLTGTVGATGGVAAGAALTAGLAGPDDPDRPDAGGAGAAEQPQRTVPHGRHQPGIALPPAPVQRLLALDLRRGVDAAALGRLLRAWTSTVVALTAGRGAPGDPAPWLADAPPVTITVGLGTRVASPGGLVAAPPGFAEVPPMRHDDLRPAWSGGDLLVMIGAHDGTTAAHAARRMAADAAPFASPRWTQTGSWNARDGSGAPITGRNLFGQVDGTASPSPDTDLFARTVWITHGPWTDGTTLVVRRIRMDLDGWDRLTRHEQELALGRRLADGAPLTGGNEASPPDLSATRDGRPVVPADAHVRLSHPSANGGLRIVRRGANYVEDRGPVVESGLLFQSLQADLTGQFVPIQAALDRGDALNAWTTAIGSASFALLPGFSRDGWLGETLA